MSPACSLNAMTHSPELILYNWAKHQLSSNPCNVYQFGQKQDLSSHPTLAASLVGVTVTIMVDETELRKNTAMRQNQCK